MPAKNSVSNRKQRNVGHADRKNKRFRKLRNKLKKELKKGTRNATKTDGHIWFSENSF